MENHHHHPRLAPRAGLSVREHDGGPFDPPPPVHHHAPPSPEPAGAVINVWLLLVAARLDILQKAGRIRILKEIH